VSYSTVLEYRGCFARSDLGSQQLGTITDLVLSPDGTRLYVASDQGVRMMVVGP